MDMIVDSALTIALICQLMSLDDISFLEESKEAVTQRVTAALAIKSTAKRATTAYE